MRRGTMRVLWVLAALSLTSASAGAKPYRERAREEILANGLKVILLEDHKAPVAVFQIWYRVGSRNESFGHTGLSHLLEHMMFKGTDKLAPEEYSRIIQRNGGDSNAFTTEDYTTYFATIASDRLGVVADLEADRMNHLTLSPEVFATERDVVREERRLRTDNNPTAALFEQLGAAAFTAHPYHNPIIGWMNDIAQATVTDVERHYRTYYVPNNAFIVAVGDFDSGELLQSLANTFGAIPPAPSPPGVRSIEPVQHGERRVELRRQAELPFVAIAYHVPNLRSHDAGALEVLARALAGGKSARLHHDLVYEQQLARSVGADYEYTSLDPGGFVLYAQPMPGQPTTRVEHALLKEIADLRDHPPEPREIEKAKNGIEASFLFAQDSLFYQALLLGQYEISGDWRWIDDYLPAVRAVTADDLLRVARFYLGSDNRTVATLVALPTRDGVPATVAPMGPIH
jgi:zinc protease